MRSTTSFCSMKCMSRTRSAIAREVEQQRRGDVVRQVADDAQPARKAREVELERVAWHATVAREIAPQAPPPGRDRSRSTCRPARFAEQPGEDALARADLDDGVVRRGCDRVDDASPARAGRAGNAGRTAYARCMLPGVASSMASLSASSGCPDRRARCRRGRARCRGRPRCGRTAGPSVTFTPRRSSRT